MARASFYRVLCLSVGGFFALACVESPFDTTQYSCREEAKDADCISGYTCVYAPSASGDWWCVRKSISDDTSTGPDTSDTNTNTDTDADTSGSQPIPGEQRAFGPSAYRYIPAGTFTMGSPVGEIGRDSPSDELQHQVTLTEGFWLKETEVTQAEWTALMGNDPSYWVTTCGPNCPVEMVAWWDVLAYCNALSVNQGFTPCYTLTGCTGTPGARDYNCASAERHTDCTGFRLPTEAEWEFAARAGTTTALYLGNLTETGCEKTLLDPLLDTMGWYCGNSGDIKHPVAQKTPNAWGLYDMSGNVWEWVWDWYGGTYEDAPQTDPSGPATGDTRVFRGGAWFAHAQFCRSAQRFTYEPAVHNNSLGFRPVKVNAVAQ